MLGIDTCSNEPTSSSQLPREVGTVPTLLGRDQAHGSQGQGWVQSRALQPQAPVSYFFPPNCPLGKMPPRRVAEGSWRPQELSPTVHWVLGVGQQLWAPVAETTHLLLREAPNTGSCVLFCHLAGQEWAVSLGAGVRTGAQGMGSRREQSGGFGGEEVTDSFWRLGARSWPETRGLGELQTGRMGGGKAERASLFPEPSKRPWGKCLGFWVTVALDVCLWL